MSDSPATTLVRKYFETHLANAARDLESMDEADVVDVLKMLPPASAARVIRQLQVSFAAELLKDAEADLFRAMATELEPSHAATVFMHLPQGARDRFLEVMPEKLKREVQEHLTFPEESVGRLMTTSFLSVRDNMSVSEAVDRIRLLAQKRMPASYCYVLDEQETLIGVMNMRDLLLASPSERINNIMRRDLFVLHAFTDREQAASELAKRRYFAAPVVDGDNRMLGIIKAEQLLAGVQAEMTEDIQRMFGAGGDERAFSPIGYSLKKRLPWLHVNLATAFLAAGVVAMFEETIARITVLAIFLPVVAGQGGNAGAQSLAIVMRGLVMREIPRAKVTQLVWKEGLLGLITGTVTGIVTALIAWAWQGNGYLGVVIGLGMIVNLFFAGLSGAGIPVLMRAFGLDPAQCSSIILTTVTDVIGFFAFLGFAVLFQDYLI